MANVRKSNVAAPTKSAAKRAAKVAKANPDLITTVVPAQGAANAYVASSAAHNVVVYSTMGKAIMDLAVVGGSIKALQSAIKALPPRPAKLARGLDTATAPHSSKAVADSRAKAAPKAEKAEKAAPKAKVAKAPKAPKADATDTRAIKVVDKSYSYGADGSKRNESWLAAKSSKTVAAYLAAGGKAKYLPRFVAAKAIVIG